MDLSLCILFHLNHDVQKKNLPFHFSVQKIEISHSPNIWTEHFISLTQKMTGKEQILSTKSTSDQCIIICFSLTHSAV